MSILNLQDNVRSRSARSNAHTSPCLFDAVSDCLDCSFCGVEPGRRPEPPGSATLVGQVRTGCGGRLYDRPGDGGIGLRRPGMERTDATLAGGHAGDTGRLWIRHVLRSHESGRIGRRRPAGGHGDLENADARAEWVPRRATGRSDGSSQLREETRALRRECRRRKVWVHRRDAGPAEGSAEKTIWGRGVRYNSVRLESAWRLARSAPTSVTTMRSPWCRKSLRISFNCAAVWVLCNAH